VQLIALARVLENNHDLSGRPLSPPRHYCVGADENPAAPPYEYRLRRAAKKALAGARPSLGILRSVGGMRFVARNVPGIGVPPEMVRASSEPLTPRPLCTRLGIAPRQERESHGHSASVAL
jgi:hypothetical protein